MNIRRIQYARVPRVEMLNHNFDPGEKHLVVTFEVDGYASPPANDFLTIYQALAALLPTLSKHKCCEQWENTPLYLQETEGVSLKWVGEVADIAHLVEHVIVDLQCAIAGMRKCSGITCGHREPENRFDLILECTDPEVGVFSAYFATYLVAAMFEKPRLSLKYRDIITAARMIIHEPDLITDSTVLAGRMSVCAVRAEWVWSALRAFGLVNTETEKVSP
jgi:hypothetical protein